MNAIFVLEANVGGVSAAYANVNHCAHTVVVQPLDGLTQVFFICAAYIGIVKALCPLACFHACGFRLHICIDVVGHNGLAAATAGVALGTTAHNLACIVLNVLAYIRTVFLLCKVDLFCCTCCCIESSERYILAVYLRIKLLPVFNLFDGCPLVVFFKPAEIGGITAEVHALHPRSGHICVTCQLGVALQNVCHVARGIEVAVDFAFANRIEPLVFYFLAEVNVSSLVAVEEHTAATSCQEGGDNNVGCAGVVPTVAGTELECTASLVERVKTLTATVDSFAGFESTLNDSSLAYVSDVGQFGDNLTFGSNELQREFLTQGQNSLGSLLFGKGYCVFISNDCELLCLATQLLVHKLSKHLACAHIVKFAVLTALQSPTVNALIGQTERNAICVYKFQRLCGCYNILNSRAATNLNIGFAGCLVHNCIFLFAV